MVCSGSGTDIGRPGEPSGAAVDVVWIMDDFPKMSVWVSKVTGVNTPGPVVQFSDWCSRRLSFGEQRVHLLAGRDNMAEAELATAHWAVCDARVFGKFATRV